MRPRSIPFATNPVVLDSDLALLYGVETRVFNQAIRRNGQRFPADFAFQLRKEEWSLLRSQIVTLKGRRGQHRKYLPWGFTEHGAIMAATILNSERAVAISVYDVRIWPTQFQCRLFLKSATRPAMPRTATPIVIRARCSLVHNCGLQSFARSSKAPCAP